METLSSYSLITNNPDKNYAESRSLIANPKYENIFTINNRLSFHEILDLTTPEKVETRDGNVRNKGEGGPRPWVVPNSRQPAAGRINRLLDLFVLATFLVCFSLFCVCLRQIILFFYRCRYGSTG